MSSISPQLLIEDFDTLVSAFHMEPSFTRESFRVFALHVTVEQLIAIGWIREHALNRFGTVLVPAGELAERLQDLSHPLIKGELRIGKTVALASYLHA